MDSPQCLLYGIPDEILTMFLSEVSKADLKSARLACTRFADTGARLLFKRTYFAPRGKVMQDFVNSYDLERPYIVENEHHKVLAAHLIGLRPSSIKTIEINPDLMEVYATRI